MAALIMMVPMMAAPTTMAASTFRETTPTGHSRGRPLRFLP